MFCCRSLRELERTPSRSVIRPMNHFRDCHREERSDVANQLIDCSVDYRSRQGSFAMTNEVNSFAEAQRRSNPASWIATTSFLRLAMTSRCVTQLG
jgi:hypothetical protein